MADAAASARAAAAAYARARVAAEATADALAVAFVMANAAANAEATAQTSVDVVPQIETSIRAIIDPDCLIPVCEEAGRIECPPCDGQDVPETTTPRPTGCPEPILLSWHFGEVPSGVMFRGSRSLPSSVSSTLNSYPIAGVIPVVHDVPADGDIVVEPDEAMAFVFGTFESGRTYTVVYQFIDPEQCPVVELTVTVTGSGEEKPEGSGQTPYTPPDQPQTRACMTISAVHEEPGFLFFPATTTEIATSIVIDGVSERVTPFQLCATATMQFMLMAQSYTPM